MFRWGCAWWIVAAIAGCSRVEVAVTSLQPPESKDWRAGAEQVRQPAWPAPARPFAQLSAIMINGKPAAIPFNPYETLESETKICIRVTHTSLEKCGTYYLITGPTDLGVRTIPAKLQIRTSSPAIHLISDWIFVWGQWPAVHTEEIVASPDSTAFAVQKFGTNGARVYLSSGNSSGALLTIKCKSTGEVIEQLRTPGTFVDVIDCTTGEIQSISADPNALSFMEAAEADARQNGWDGNG